jgi:hypothetical protein
LVREASDFGFLKPPRRRQDIIEHDGGRIRFITRQADTNGDHTVTREFEPGGAAVRVWVIRQERWVRGWWEEDVLVVETSWEVSGHARRLEDRWHREGDRLILERRHEMNGGPVRQRLIFAAAS